MTRSQEPNRIFLLLVLLVVLVLLLWRPGVDFLRVRITQSISRGLGRQVEIGNVSLQVLPRPGFELSQFVVHDDPRFSNEPMLRADEVTALLHLSSIWRRRIEIAQLNLKEPSLNLVRASDGRWNIESLLERAAQIPVAPTAKVTSEARPRFPYIEADQGRINFRVGLEKKAYALTAADFSLWLESEGEWGMRLRARPVRVDMSSSDTGTLRVNGSWKRAPELSQTPVQLSASLDGAQLGQLTKLILGQDKGWRGGVRLSATLAGTLGDIAITTDATVQDFRRYDIFAGPAPLLSAHCAAHYRSAEFSDIACRSPLGTGSVRLTGSTHGWAGGWQHELYLNADALPAQVVVDLARRAKKNIPEDLTATGIVTADLTFLKDANSVSWSGEGEASSVVLRSRILESDLPLDSIPFRLVSETARHSGQGVRNKKTIGPQGNYLEMGPFAVPLGRGEPAKTRAWFARRSYGLSFTGEGSLQQLLRTARVAGITTPALAIEGTASFDLATAEPWTGFSGPQMNGTILLRDVRAEFLGLNAPLLLSSGTLVLTNGNAQLQGIAATLGEMHWSGSAVRSLSCSSCPTEVDLKADELSSDELDRLLNPDVVKRPWYRILSGSAPATDSEISRLNLRGKLSVNRLSLRSLVATHISAGVALDRGQLHLSDIRADVFGGRHTGNWNADWNQQPPVYSGAGKLTAVSLTQVSKLLRQDWVTGTGDGEYELQFAGGTSQDLRTSAFGTLSFDAHDGVFSHVRVKPASPLRFQRFRGELSLKAGTFTLQEGKLDGPSGIYQVSGTATFGGKLDFRLAQNPDSVLLVKGALTALEIEPAKTASTEVKLKK